MHVTISCRLWSDLATLHSYIRFDVTWRDVTSSWSLMSYVMRRPLFWPRQRQAHDYILPIWACVMSFLHRGYQTSLTCTNKSFISSIIRDIPTKKWPCFLPYKTQNHWRLTSFSVRPITCDRLPQKEADWRQSEAHAGSKYPSGCKKSLIGWKCSPDIDLSRVTN